MEKKTSVSCEMMVIVVVIYTNSESSKYTLDPIHRTMKKTGTPMENQTGVTGINPNQHRQHYTVGE